MSKVEAEGLFRLTKPSGVLYSAPDVAYADDLISFAASLLGIQRKADMVSIVASILGLRIAIRKLRLLRKRWDLPSYSVAESLILHRYMPAEVHVPFTTESVIKQLGVLYDADCSGKTQLKLSLDSFRQSIRAIAWKRASPESIIYALEASSSSQVAYRATLSNWTWAQYEQFDSILAVELRHRTKNMATAQTDNLYQPAEHGGQGFHKISVRCNEGKKAFIDRALRHSDYQTKWAIRMLINRAGATWPSEGPQGPIEDWRTGWYISSLLEHGLRARRALYRPCPTKLFLHSSIYDWTGSTHESRKAAQLEGISSVGDLTEIRAFEPHRGERVWSHWALSKAYLELYTRQRTIPTGSIHLTLGQVWQVLESAHEPKSVLEITGLSSQGVWFVRWWKPRLLHQNPPRVGQSLQRKDPTARYAPFDQVFPASATFRQLFLTLPSTSTSAGAKLITRTVLRWKVEHRPDLPPVATPLILHPSAPSTTSTVQIYMGQHRCVAKPWAAVFAEVPTEVIWGSVVLRATDTAGTDTWTGFRFQYTDSSGPTSPSAYMIWTLLAYWAFHSIPVPLNFADCTFVTPCFNLASRVNSGANAKRWGKTQQGFLASLIRSTFLQHRSTF